jgi:hypothetical protein
MEVRRESEIHSDHDLIAVTWKKIRARKKVKRLVSFKVFAIATGQLTRFRLSAV